MESPGKYRFTEMKQYPIGGFNPDRSISGMTLFRKVTIK